MKALFRFRVNVFDDFTVTPHANRTVGILDIFSRENVTEMHVRKTVDSKC